MPTTSVTASQLMTDIGSGVPICFCQSIAPLVALILYTLLRIVLAIRLGPITNGWAYCWPETGVLNIWPNWPDPTKPGDSPGSLGSQPSRAESPLIVMLSASAVRGSAAGDSPTVVRDATTMIFTQAT